ncbi:hypothetical protein M436DRAFT_67737 [Aureobasidium namibiae CBS 147.97]|uniref:F-box domain-containing protein n=1 Tax=Aureobasidium namibiae CBS 147.97 TaxID=1043004 RepID=A0A074W7H3_9PEZI
MSQRVMTSTVDTMLDSATKPSDRVPDELWEKFLSHLVRDRGTLLAIAQGHGRGPDQAERLYWRNDLAAPGLLDTLDIMPDYVRQSLAHHIRHITMRFKPTGQRRVSPVLQFPQLRSITVMTTGVLHSEGYLHVEACVGRLLGPRLQYLDIGSDRWWPHDLLPSTDNFLPVLSTCLDLRELSVCARIGDASSQHLVAVLNSCKELKMLYLSSHTAPLIDPYALQALAEHRSIETLEIQKVIDLSLASTIMKIEQPFRHLLDLTLHATPDGASIVLPQLQRLKTLRLVISRSGSVFPAVGKVKTLQSFSFESASFPLTDHDLSYMKSLKHLESLQFHNGQQRRRQHQGFVKQDWADQLAQDLDRHAPKLHWIYSCLDEKDDMAQMAANAWWFSKDKREFRAFLERDGTPEEVIDRYVSEFTPVSDWEEAHMS